MIEQRQDAFATEPLEARLGVQQACPQHGAHQRDVAAAEHVPEQRAQAEAVDAQARGEVDGGPVTINRSGDLYFVEDPDSGDWKIAAYDIGVSRITDEGKTSATADGAAAYHES